jgi:hypothetical protein
MHGWIRATFEQGVALNATRLQFGHPLKHLQQHFPYRRIGTHAYNADNRRGVAGVADVGLQPQMPP